MKRVPLSAQNFFNPVQIPGQTLQFFVSIQPFGPQQSRLSPGGGQ